VKAWRVGAHYKVHVYEDQRPVATFFTEADARYAVDAHNLCIRVVTPDLTASVISPCEFCDQSAVAVVEGVWMCQGHVTAHDQIMSGDAS
jgi:hypothetical protein